MILGISGSGHRDGVSAHAVKAILEHASVESVYISAAGKRISGCTACLRCAGDNVCKVDDDWLEIGERMKQADAIVFGAPNYYGVINAIGHAIWERTYSFRHNSRFALAGKLGVLVGTNDEAEASVIPYVKSLMHSNKMAIAGQMTAAGYAPCYRCGYGHHCVVGSVVPKHGLLDTVEQEHFPPGFAAQCGAEQKAMQLGRMLSGMLGD